MYYFPYDEPLFRPPSEAHSLIFQITLGCSQNICTFCGMYKGKSFCMRPVDEVLAEIARVPEAHRPFVQRVFLADGDALVYPKNGLLAILEAFAAAFPGLSRIGAYASPASLTNKDEADLAQLRERKLRILYFGLESGDAATLASVNKGFAPAEMLAQCRKAQDAAIKLSVTAILGLAGRARSREHARASRGAPAARREDRAQPAAHVHLEAASLGAVFGALDGDQPEVVHARQAAVVLGAAAERRLELAPEVLAIGMPQEES